MRGPNPLLTLALDAGYLLAGLAALLAGALRGRLSGTLDHVKRRALSAPPERTGERPCLWLHGVSVGEVLSAKRLVERIAESFPSWDVVISASTRLGVEAARREYPDRIVVSYPLDFGFLVRRAFRRLRPNVVVIVEHDLWPNFLRCAVARQLPVALVNARLSPRSLAGYRWISRIYPWPPRGLAAICVQDESSAGGFRELGYPPGRIHVAGNIKFDNPPPPAAQSLRDEMGFEDDDWILVAGSTHESEEEAALEAFAEVRRRHERSYLILVPRRIERTEAVAQLIESRGFSHRLWSQERRRGPDVHLVDTIGELARISAIGDVVFVGGTLVPVGGHNVIEPAAFGRPIVIGPHHYNARSVVESFLERDGLLVVTGPDEFVKAIVALREDPRRAHLLGENAAATVRDNTGAGERILERLKELMER